MLVGSHPPQTVCLTVDKKKKIFIEKASSSVQGFPLPFPFVKTNKQTNFNVPCPPSFPLN